MMTKLDSKGPSEPSTPSTERRLIFSVPLVTCSWPESEELNADLRTIILSMMSASPGTVKTNRRGWQSNSDFHLLQHTSVRKFVDRIYAALRELIPCIVDEPEERHFRGWNIQACWANVNPPGGYNRPHHHDGARSQLSGFYYVDFGDDLDDAAKRGKTRFENRSGVPRDTLHGRDKRSYEVALVPNPGTMAMFPASAYHYVEPYAGATQRISIAFNLYHTDFRVMYYEGMQQPGWWSYNFRGLMVLPRKIPEKLLGIALIPQLVSMSPRGMPGGLISWAKHARTAVSHAFAEASARAEERRERSRG